jgi:hypothetical protein
MSPFSFWSKSRKADRPTDNWTAIWKSSPKDKAVLASLNNALQTSMPTRNLVDFLSFDFSHIINQLLNPGPAADDLPFSLSDRMNAITIPSAHPDSAHPAHRDFRFTNTAAVAGFLPDWPHWDGFGGNRISYANISEGLWATLARLGTRIWVIGETVAGGLDRSRRLVQPLCDKIWLDGNI